MVVQLWPPSPPLCRTSTWDDHISRGSHGPKGSNRILGCNRGTFSRNQATTLLHLGQIPTAHSTQLPLSIVGRPTNLRPPQTSFHMTSFFRRPNFRRYYDVSNVARETLQTSQERRCKRGKRDVSNVARPTFQTWQERRCKRGKRDVSNVARPTFQTSQERR
jgi:hypothetical protein